MGLLGWSNSIRALQRGLSYSRSKTRAASLPLIGAGKRRDKALAAGKAVKWISGILNHLNDLSHLLKRT
jgi:hypothetical protein